MRRACAIAVAMMASLPAMAGTLEACRAAQPEAGDVSRCVQAARKACLLYTSDAADEHRDV